ncbi:MAG: ABC transporter permease subunit [Actinomycetota bacterium]
MLRSLFGKTLHERGKSLFWWCLGVGLTVIMFIAVYPSVAHMPNIDKFLEAYPEAMRKIFGIQDFGSGPGYLNSEMMSMVAPIIFLVFAIGFGGGATSTEEERKTIDLLATLPISRVRIVVEKALAMLAGALMIGIVMFACVWLGGPLAGLHVSTANLAGAMLSQVLLGLAFGYLAMALGCLTGKRAFGVGAASGVAVACFVLYSLGTLTDAFYRKSTLFYQAVGYQPLSHGLDLSQAAILAGFAALAFVAAVVAFKRRDLAT